MRKFSLKSKIALYSALVFFAFVPLGTSIALHYFRQQLTASIEDQLFTTVSLLALELDQKIKSMRSVAIKAARGISPDLLTEPQRALAYLNRQFGLLDLFDNGLLLFTADGKILAETGNIPSRTGLDLSYRPYIQKTRQTLEPYISHPFVSSQAQHHPVVVMTVPILDPQGKLSGIFAGIIDLLGKNVLVSLSTAKVGQTGYFYLFTYDRMMVMHPDRSRIMQQDVPPGANKLLDMALEGFQGAGETVNSRGLHTLVAFKRLRSVNWILAANYPADEAFAPVRKATRSAWLIVACGGLLVVTTMWLSMRHLIGPLLSLIDQLKKVSDNQNQQKRVKANTRDEIGELAEAFNKLMGELENRESELAKSKELYQTLADWSANWIFWNSPSGKVHYVSPAATKITGYSTEELMEFADNFEGLVHPEDHDRWLQHQREADQGRELPPFDFRIITKNGEIRWISHSCQPIHDENGEFLGLRGSNTDITERKRIEEQLHHLSVRDSLTGLYNRGYFDAELARFARGRLFPVSLVIGDLDALKTTNDTMGHVAGDQLIRQAARLLQKSFRTEDVVARIGGDEFAVLMPGADNEAVSGAVRRFRELESEHKRSGAGMIVAFSLGTFTATDRKTMETAMKIADARMYQDKERRKAEKGQEEMP
jgi:two-component system, NtrC family, sensor kinase